MSSDANHPPGPSQPPPEPNPANSTNADGVEGSAAPRRKILIGSQRDPDAYKPKPRRDWISPRKAKDKRPDKPPREPGDLRGSGEQPPSDAGSPPGLTTASELARADDTSLAADIFPAVSIVAAPQQDFPLAADRIVPPVMPELAPVPPELDTGLPEVATGLPEVAAEMPEISPKLPKVSVAPPEAATMDSAADPILAETAMAAPVEFLAPGKKVPRPSIRGKLPADLEEEFQAALADVPLDTLILGSDGVGSQSPLEPDSRHAARVAAVGREDVFLDLGGRDQAVIPLKVFAEPPQPGAVFEIVIVRYNQEDGFYEATLPLAAAEIGDWSQIAEGMVVEARVTGHNTGGLECEVNRLRGFIPVSQVALYRVEDLAEFVGQKLNCLVTEANPHRRNLVLSRRAVLEREREESLRAMFESLAPGQIREGVVRKILDFGAFVDLGGGVHGLIHVSQLGWGRVKHPSEVVQEGQKIRVRVDKVDLNSRKISLSYKDLLENPWNDAEQKYMPNAIVRGKVVKIMDFGAFVELEPGVEGLVHISELSHKRVPRVSDVVKEGDEIQAAVLSVDAKSQRISLSMKNALSPPEAAPPADAPTQESPKPKTTKQPSKPLLGGLGRSPKGAKFGLKW